MPLKATASMIQNATPAMLLNLNEAWNAMMIGAVMPKMTWKSIQCLAVPMRPSQGIALRNA